MSTTMVASEVKAVPPAISSIQDIPLAKIRESKTNPRRFFDEAKLAELADNIRQHGVLQPILVRPLPDEKAGTYELVAGTRFMSDRRRLERPHAVDGGCLRSSPGLYTDSQGLHA